MFKNLTQKISAAAVIATVGSVMLLSPLSAAAGNTQSQGQGVKCYWVLTSSDAATGSNVYTRVCRKSGV